MEPNELRIGNYLQGLNGYIVRVSRIEPTQLGVEGEKLAQPVVTNYSYVKPIKLNPVLLESAGFTVLEKGEDHPLYFHDKLSTNMYVEYNFSSTYSFCIATDDGQFVDVIRSFRYVHELQNIFFALTGYELELSFDERQDEEKATGQSLQ